MKRLTESADEKIAQITEKYVVDYFNSVFFADSLNWSGIDQFNSLPILNNEEDKKVKFQQRGALLVHRKNPVALRVLVTVEETIASQVCYRVVSPQKPFELDDPQRKIFPPEQLRLDFSIADTNLGCSEDSAYHFAYNIKADNRKAVVINLLRFLLNSDPYSYENGDMFSDLLNDPRSLPPVVGDPHFQLIFGVSRGE